MTIFSMVFALYVGIGIIITVACLWQAAMSGDITSDYLSYKKSFKHPKIRCTAMYLFLALITVAIWPIPMCLWIIEWIRERTR